VLLSSVLLWTAVLPSAKAQGDKLDEDLLASKRPSGLHGHAHLFPPKSHPYGQSYSEWSGAWWRWAYSFPAGEDTSPVQDPTGNLAHLGQSGRVWFLAGTFGGNEPVTRTVTVPAGRALFFPIINALWINVPELGDNPWSDEQRDFARSIIAPFIDNAFNLSCTIDGVEIERLKRYRTATPDGEEYMVTLPEGNQFGLPPGTYGPSIDDGIYLMLKPLSPGEHTIHFTAASEGSALGPAALDVTYHLNVVRPARVFPPQSHPYGMSYADWLGTYWRWYYGGADPAQSKVGRVQLMPIPNGELVSGTGTPDDPALLRGKLEITLPPGTPFVLPAFAWIGERYDGYPAEPDDLPVADDVLLAGVHPNMTVDGLPVLTDANKEAYYVPPTPFDPIVVYPAPSSYGSVAAIFFQSAGIVTHPLPPGRHEIRLYEPYIIPAGAYAPLPDGFGVIYDNTWIVTVSKE
jgi:hypothetical protein